MCLSPSSDRRLAKASAVNTGLSAPSQRAVHTNEGRVTGQTQIGTRKEWEHGMEKRSGHCSAGRSGNQYGGTVDALCVCLCVFCAQCALFD